MKEQSLIQAKIHTGENLETRVTDGNGRREAKETIDILRVKEDAIWVVYDIILSCSNGHVRKLED